MLALKNTARAQRLYKPVARMASVRKARRRVWAWSIICLILAVIVTTWPSMVGMWLFAVAVAILMYRMVGWQDIAQRRWEKENNL